jgi:hypothetical protein
MIATTPVLRVRIARAVRFGRYPNSSIAALIRTDVPTRTVGSARKYRDTV